MSGLGETKTENYHFRAFLSLFEKYGQKREALKLKTAVMLQDVLDITRLILTLYQDDPQYMGDPYDVESRDEKIEKLMQLCSFAFESSNLKKSFI
jgi:hypothetical protein